MNNCTASSFYWYSIASADIIQRGIIENILFQLSIALPSVLRFARSLSTIYRDNWKISNKLVLTIDQKLYDKLYTMHESSILTDEPQRREFAIQYLKERRSKITEKQYLYEQNWQ